MSKIKKISNPEYVKYLQNLLQNLESDYKMHFFSNKDSEDEIPYIEEDSSTFGSHEQGAVEFSSEYGTPTYKMVYWIDSYFDNAVILHIYINCNFADTQLHFEEIFTPSIDRFKTFMQTSLVCIEKAVSFSKEEQDKARRFIKLLDEVE